jgi:hypothetical protein
MNPSTISRKSGFSVGSVENSGARVDSVEGEPFAEFTLVLDGSVLDTILLPGL